jgi:hypothetical protein
MKLLTIEQLKKLRIERGENQGVFWGRVRVTQSGSSRYESGRKPNEHVLITATLVYGTEAQKKAVLKELQAA